MINLILDKIGKKVLIFSLIGAIFFIVTGIVLNLKTSEDEHDPESYDINVSKIYHITVNAGEEYAAKFNANENGIYYIYLEGATLKNIKDSNGNYMSPYRIDKNGTGLLYYFTTHSYLDIYSITFKATSSYVTINVYR